MTSRRFRSSCPIAAVVVLLLALLIPPLTAASSGKCRLVRSLRDEIASYRPVVERVLSYVQDKNGYKGRTWAALSEFTDTFGSRLAGTSNLENSIDYMMNSLRAENLDNVHAERVMFTGWQRRKENAALVKPRFKNLAMLGLGGSVSTAPEGIRAEVVVVTSFDDLSNKSSQVSGKIVVYNQPYVSYSETVVYRSMGASEASKYGAVATLIRSITPFSLNTPHAGHQSYSEGVKKIPTACITVEDAELLYRMYNRGTKLEIFLKMDSKFFTNATSRNTVAEIKGTTEPDKIVLVSGHLDSWDVGQGAMDDGGGAFISWNSLVVLKNLKLRPKRSIRCLLWTAEEEGYIGAYAYLKGHKSELEKFNLVIESDEGTFQPYGIEFHGSETSACIMVEVAKLFDSINATTMQSSKYNVGSDIEVFENINIPGLSLLNRNEKYFWYHHTEADTMAVEDPDSLDLNTAMFAVISYIIADLSVELPKS
ncbi:carboxypeptidase Q-like [Metopolophium dirhodum]|uniref:carboxypeptidase Q-like n=1 Tax=Metopolophium dirhodum TaxID=44670 RepID=UPI00298FC6DE|nr:carboxypeptidase Q-like [Metopolophium dirhodum]XP_060868809.1 carboxypeptidase Q-like [Metopolophium dirhodum]XP_060868810.1 carboxypeptidase Q-like [Metopolophium dirhodum]